MDNNIIPLLCCFFVFCSSGRQEEAADFVRKGNLRINLDLVNNFARFCQSHGDVSTTIIVYTV